MSWHYSRALVAEYSAANFSDGEPSALSKLNPMPLLYSSSDRLDHPVMAANGGQLNPDWVEWLMGWPIGLTDLKPLAMDKYQQWLQQHSGFCQEDE